jgi:hypothetical protein
MKRSAPKIGTRCLVCGGSPSWKGSVLCIEHRQEASKKPAKRREQIVSFAFGNLKLAHPETRKEDVEAAYDRMGRK